MGKKAKGKKTEKAVEVKDEELVPEEFKDLTIPQLREKIEAYQYRLNKAAKERNYMQLEKDMVNHFYEITQEETSLIEATLLNKSRQMEMMERDHRVHIRVHEQKVQNLEYEHKQEVDIVKSEEKQTLQTEQETHEARLQAIDDDKRQMAQTLSERRLTNDDDIKMLQTGLTKNLAKLRETFEANHQVLVRRYEDLKDKLYQDLELRRKVEIHEVEERKNQHINDLLFNHQEAFDQIKAYYNDITHDNLQLIQSLKEEISQMRQKEKQNQKKMQQLTIENKNLTEPLAQKERIRRELEDQLKSYNKDKMALRNLKARSIQLEERNKEAKTDCRSLEDKCRKLEKERDDLQRRFQKSVRDIRRKFEFKNVVLEKQLEQFTKQYKQNQTEFNEVLQSSRIDPQVVANVTKKLEQVLSSKNHLIKDLQYQAHYCTKVYNDTIKVYDTKLKQLGVPTEEVSFEELPTATSTMPCNLVVRAAV
eukprot:GEMP01023231.1.p1 GENE.GEMP01023231.1~~GEMP01023231.1.p1  ORF type:complete len:478 (+),score=119.51 GEMP01023231.1:106-1539(+)